jgi:hypothetical protein
MPWIIELHLAHKKKVSQDEEFKTFLKHPEDESNSDIPKDLTVALSDQGYDLMVVTILEKQNAYHTFA